MKYYLLLMVSCLFVGCQSTFEFERSLADKKGYSQWIGKQFKLKKDMFVVSHGNYISPRLEQLGGQSYPTIEDYRKGETKKVCWHILDRRKVIGIVEAGSKLQIINIGLCNFGVTMGDSVVVIVKDRNDNKFYIRCPVLFASFNGTLEPHEAYVEMLSEKGTD